MRVGLWTALIVWALALAAYGCKGGTPSESASPEKTTGGVQLEAHQVRVIPVQRLFQALGAFFERHHHRFIIKRLHSGASACQVALA